MRVIMICALVRSSKLAAESASVQRSEPLDCIRCDWRNAQPSEPLDSSSMETFLRRHLLSFSDKLDGKSGHNMVDPGHDQTAFLGE